MSACKTIILSVGALTVSEILHLYDHTVGFHIYEPLSEARQKFIKEFGTQNNRMRVFHEAIASKRGDRILDIKGSASSIVTKSKDRNISGKCVSTITLEDAVERVYKQHSATMLRFLLVMNCEGAEHEIITNTRPSIFSKFDEVKIEFHPEIITKEMIVECNWILAPIFIRRIEYKTSKTKQPVSVFSGRKRKNNNDN